MLSGASPGPCPNAPNAAAIAYALHKAMVRVCTACGGRDLTCGGADDLTPAEIGSPASCPNVTIPGGASCGAPIDDLQDIVQCLACVTEYTSVCIDRAGVRALKSYPPECQ